MLTPFSSDMNIIAKLPPTITRNSGYTADQIKALFDLDGNSIKTYLNESLIPEIEAGFLAAWVGTLEEYNALTNKEGVVHFIYED